MYELIITQHTFSPRSKISSALAPRTVQCTAIFSFLRMPNERTVKRAEYKSTPAKWYGDRIEITHTHLTALCLGLPRWTKSKTNLDFPEARDSEWQWHHLDYISLHLAPNRKPRQHPTTQFFTGWMPFLPPNRQCQSTEGIQNRNKAHEQSNSSQK